MPIVSRILIQLANRDDIAKGWKKWRVDGVDERGGKWVHGPFGGTRADAEAAMLTCWPDDQRQDHEEYLAGLAVEGGEDPDGFPIYELTRAELRHRLARRFWRATLDDDGLFLKKMAPRIAAYTAKQLATVLGVTETKAQQGIDRAIKIRDTIIPETDDVDSKAEEV